jgi:adenylate kinase family enzyme
MFSNDRNGSIVIINSQVVVNSQVDNSTLTHKISNFIKSPQRKDLTREEILEKIREFAKQHDQSIEWVMQFARNYLGIDYQHDDNLSLIDLVNIKNALEKYE